MSDLAWLVAGNVSAAAAGYLVVCWKDYCSRPVDPADEVGLCEKHREELRGQPPAA